MARCKAPRSATMQQAQGHGATSGMLKCEKQLNRRDAGPAAQSGSFFTPRTTASTAKDKAVMNFLRAAAAHQSGEVDPQGP